jgi:hypothetical protein
VWIGDKRKNNIWDRRQKINKLEATTTSVIPPQDTPKAFKKSTHKAIKVDDEDDDKIDELQTAPFSSQEAKLHINADIRDMSKLLGKTSQKVIKIMMDGVKGGKYTAMDIARGVKEGPAGRTHFGELTFIQSLWNKVRDKFRRYSKHGKLS